MLELGFNVEVTDEHYGTPLKYAVTWDHKDVVELLLEHGADCNRRDNGKQTPLFHVASVAVAKLLLDSGARVDLVDDQGRTCVEYHLEYGREDIVDLLVKHGAKRDPRWELGLNEAQTMERGREVLHEYFRTEVPERLKEYELSLEVDYGSVLPVRGIPIE
jgi:ankyrin repeat protein